MSVMNTNIPRFPEGYDGLLARYHAEVARWCEVIAELVSTQGDERDALVSQSLRYVNAIDRQRVMEIESACIKEIMMQIRYDQRRTKKKAVKRLAVAKNPANPCGGGEI